MGMPVAELAARMTAQEFVEHWTDYRLNPWGEQRNDLRAGMIASMLFNINRGKDTPPRSPTDFVLYRYEVVDEADVRRQYAKQQQKRRKR